MIRKDHFLIHFIDMIFLRLASTIVFMVVTLAAIKFRFLIKIRRKLCSHIPLAPSHNIAYPLDYAMHLPCFKVYRKYLF